MEELKAKLSLIFGTVAQCSSCRFCFDIDKYRGAGIDVSDFNDAKNICRNQNRLLSLHLKGEDEDGFIAIYKCPEEDICKYWKPNHNTTYIDPKLTDMEIGLTIGENIISDDDIKKITEESEF